MHVRSTFTDYSQHHRDQAAYGEQVDARGTAARAVVTLAAGAVRRGGDASSQHYGIDRGESIHEQDDY